MEDFVTYEQAVKLKELGFNEPCNHLYDSIKILEENIEAAHKKVNECHIYTSYINWNSCDTSLFVAAPTLYQVQKWLMKEHNIKVIPNYVKNNFYTCKMFWVDSQGFEQFTQCEENPYVINLESYEKALSVGIDFAIKYLNV